VKYITFFLLISVIFSQEKYNGHFRGRPCDDTEVRGYSGLPAWKNYGEWLSECDSLASAWEDSTFAIILEERNKKRLEEEKRREEEIAAIDFDKELDLDAMWDNTVWNEITEIGEEYVGEVEQITAVAGVRGAEAEDEALHYLYYRRSMKGIAMIDLQKAYGKLINTRANLTKSDPQHPKLEKINFLLLQLEIKMKKV
jgi:hypothetical protein